ncbi:MAG: hypothetical protein K1X86_07425 [Ignavibacteria bacterium]|nr:hypothetical protein [Ignavibacteria bacterium]
MEGNLPQQPLAQNTPMIHELYVRNYASIGIKNIIILYDSSTIPSNVNIDETKELLISQLPPKEVTLVIVGNGALPVYKDKPTQDIVEYVQDGIKYSLKVTLVVGQDVVPRDIKFEKPDKYFVNIIIQDND